jgi:Calcineurin-like phosphoesterase/Purple acid Phosphatase, N-terminal domain
MKDGPIDIASIHPHRGSRAAAAKRFGLVGLALASALLLPACLSGATDPATDVTATTATLNGHGNADGAQRNWFFKYGTTTDYGSQSQGGSVPGSFNGSVAEDITGLQPNTTYHYRLCANGGCGADRTFTTLPDNGFDSRLRRYPYLTDVVGNSATVNWATDRSATTGTLKYGVRSPTTGLSCKTNSVSATRLNLVVNAVNEYQWKARITGLQPDTEFCYRVYLGDSPQVDLLGSQGSPHARSQLAAGSSEPFKFVVFGDWGQVDASGANPDQANVMDEIAESDARFALTTGDNGYPSGTQNNYGDLQQTGLNLSAIFGPSFWKVPGASLPIFPSIGNHGFTGSTPHRDNWPQDVAVQSSNGSYLAGPARYWYAFSAGNARFYVLEAAWSDSPTSYQDDYNAHWTPTSAEYQWLANDLASHPADLKFAIFHFPLYSDQKGEPSDTFLRGPTSLEGLLAANEVDMAFYGHAHIYQRNLDPGPGPAGLVSYLTGGGGADVQSIGESGCSAIDAYGIGWSDTSGLGNACGAAPVPNARSQIFHFLEVSVDGMEVTVRPIDSQGNEFDVQTYDFSITGDNEAPSAPSDLMGNAPWSGQVDLDWTGSTDNLAVSGYEIDRRPDGGGSFTQIDTTDAETTSFSDTTVAGNTAYEYRVRAFDAAGNVSDPSNTVDVTTPPAVTLTFSVGADARVEEATPNTNHGTSNHIDVDASVTGSDGEKSYLRFAVSGATTVREATLRLFSRSNPTTDGPAVYGTDTSWIESGAGGITWNNRPPANTEASDEAEAIAANSSVDLDVTPIVTGDGTWSLLLDPTSDDGIEFHSREATDPTKRPVLIVTIG